MTREDILHKNNLRDFKELGEKVNNRITTYSATFASMDEWARQESIEFANFIIDNSYTKSEKGWYQYYVQRKDYPAGYSTSTPIYTYLTIEDIYELYLLQSKQK